MSEILQRQDCIPVGCVPPACWPHPNMHWAGWVSAQEGCLPRGCLPGGVVCPGGLPAQEGWQTPPPLRTEWQTGVKTLPCRNFVADSKYLVRPKYSKVMFSVLCVCHSVCPQGKTSSNLVTIWGGPYIYWQAGSWSSTGRTSSCGQKLEKNVFHSWVGSQLSVKSLSLSRIFNYLIEVFLKWLSLNSTNSVNHDQI